MTHLDDAAAWNRTCGTCRWQDGGMTQTASSASVSLGASAPASQAPTIPGWEHHSSGKVRDVYAPVAEGP